MRKGDVQLGGPLVNYSGTTAELAALTGIQAGAQAWDETLEHIVEYDGLNWNPIAGGTGAVDSVNGQTGTVTLDAGNIPNTPAGNISATDVQAAINELDSEKLPTSYLDTDGTLASNSDVKIPSQKATKTYVDNAVTGLLEFKGATDCSANPNYPAALKGDTYVVSVVGKIGGASGKTVGVGDMFVAIADNAGGTEASVGTSWVAMESNIRTTDDVLEGAANKYVSAVNMWTVFTSLTATTPSDGDYAVYIRTTSGDLRKVTMSTFRDSYLRPNLDTIYALAAKGVTNGDSHDHNGGDGAAITDANLSTSDITTNDASTSKHGFLKKLDNSSVHFMDGQGNWSTPSGTGAPTTAEYLTTASDGTLSAEVVIPGLAGSADRAGVGGAGTSEEYDTSTTGLTWNSAPATVDSDTTVKSHLYVNVTDATEYFGTKSWSPAGALDVRCRLAIAAPSNSSTPDSGLLIMNSDNSVRALAMLIRRTPTYWQVEMYTYSGGAYAQRGSIWTGVTNEIYFRITRDGSNNFSFYYSSDGLVWQLVATQALTMTVAKLGYRIADAAHETVVDWLRSDV